MNSSNLRKIFRLIAELVKPAERLAVSRDPADDRIVEAAIAGNADYIVSGDQDLLTIGSFRGIPIVTPAQFLEAFNADS